MTKGRIEEFHPKAKIILPVAFKMYEDIENGIGVMEVARKYNVSRWTVNKMVKGSHWTHKYWKSH